MITQPLLVGAVSGCLMPTAQDIFGRLRVVLGDAVRLLDLYHNYQNIVDTILELFVECGRRMLCFLSPSSSKVRLGSAHDDML